MDLNWTHQYRRMDENLKHKLDSLEGSYASPRQTLNIIHTVIIPSLAYAFAVTPCSYPDLDKCNDWKGDQNQSQLMEKHTDCHDP